MVGLREFICKSCGKKSHDELARAPYEMKDGTKIIEENIDLCRPCFKQERKEQNLNNYLMLLCQKKVLTSPQEINRWLTDSQFRNKLIQEHFRSHKGDLKARNKAYVENLLKKQLEAQNKK